MKKGIFSVLAVLMVFAMIMVGCDSGGSSKGKEEEKTEEVTISFDVNLPAGFAGANFTVDPVKIEKNAQIGEKLPAAPTTDGADVALLDLGVNFLGWYTAASGGAPINAQSAFSADTTVYAQWFTWDATVDIAVFFDLNYDGAPAATVVTNTKDDALGAKFPADPARAGTVAGKDTTNDTWKFLGWFQYEAGSGDKYDADKVISASITVYAKWEPTTGWPPDTLPANVDLAGAEKIVLENAFFAVYRFVLPAGKTYADYSGITVDYLVGPENFNKSNSARATRLMGNYTNDDFGPLPVILDDPTTSALPQFIVANYNNSKNAPYIIDDLGSGWSSIAAATASWGIDAKPWEWFTVSYKLDGSRKNSGFEAKNMPAPTATGPFYFGLGFAGQGGGGTTQWLRNVKLVGNTGTASVNAIPLWFKDGAELYPAFTGYNTSDGSNGTKEAFRAMVDGSQPEPVNFTAGPPAGDTIDIALDLNYTGKPANTSVTIDKGAALGAALTTPTRDGFVFLGWYQNAAGTGTAVTAATTFASAATLYAKWIEQITISFDLNYEDATGAPKDVTIDKGTALGDKYPADPERDDWNFAEWNTAKEGDGDTVDADTVLDATATLYAKWMKAPIDITLSLNYPTGGPTTTTTKRTISTGGSLTAAHLALPVKNILTTAKIFYKPKGWFSAATDGTAVTTTTTFDAATTIYLQWEVFTPTAITPDAQSVNKVGFVLIEELFKGEPEVGGKYFDATLLNSAVAGSMLRVYINVLPNESDGQYPSRAGWGIGTVGGVSLSGKAGTDFYLDVLIDDVVLESGAFHDGELYVNIYNQCGSYLIELWEFAGALTYTSQGTITMPDSDLAGEGKGDIEGEDLAKILAMPEGSYLEVTIDCTDYTGQVGWGAGMIGGIGYNCLDKVEPFVLKIDLWELKSKTSGYATKININPYDHSKVAKIELFKLD